jgi:hypothetical protein
MALWHYGIMALWHCGIGSLAKTSTIIGPFSIGCSDNHMSASCCLIPCIYVFPRKLFIIYFLITQLQFICQKLLESEKQLAGTALPGPEER